VLQKMHLFGNLFKVQWIGENYQMIEIGNRIQCMLITYSAQCYKPITFGRPPHKD